MVNKVKRLKRRKKIMHDPIHLVWMVKKVVRLRCRIGLARAA
jgi:hypothetical protein